MKWLWYFVFSFCSLRLFYFAPDYKWAFPMYAFGVLLVLIFWPFYSYRVTPWNEFDKKIMFFNIGLYHVLGTLFFCIAQYNRLTQYDAETLFRIWGKEISITASAGVSEYIFYVELSVVPILVFLNHRLLKNIIKNTYMVSDYLNDKHIFLGVFKPKNYLSIVFSIFRLTPISGVFIYANNCVYAFRKNQAVIQKLSARVLCGEYTLINTGLLISEKQIEFENLIGQKWTLRNNCITVFNKILGESVFDIVKRRLFNAKG